MPKGNRASPADADARPYDHRAFLDRSGSVRGITGEEQRREGIYDSRLCRFRHLGLLRHYRIDSNCGQQVRASHGTDHVERPPGNADPCRHRSDASRRIPGCRPSSHTKWSAAPASFAHYAGQGTIQFAAPFWPGYDDQRTFQHRRQANVAAVFESVPSTWRNRPASRRCGSKISASNPDSVIPTARSQSDKTWLRPRFAADAPANGLAPCLGTRSKRSS